jgi:hypothetical protein
MIALFNQRMGIQEGKTDVYDGQITRHHFFSPPMLPLLVGTQPP